MLLLLLAALAAATWPAGVLAYQDESLAAARVRQEESRSLQAETAFTNDVCGISLQSRIIWKKSESWPNDGKGIAKACDGALGAMESLCRSGRKADIAGAIKSFQCSGDGSGPSLSGKTLRFGASPGGNGFQSTKAFLEANL